MTPRSQSGCRPGVGIQVTKASPHLVPAFSPSVDPGSPGDVAKIGQLEASQGCSLFSQGQGSGAAQFHHRPLHYDRRGGGQPEGAVTSRVKHPQETPEIGSWDFGRDMSETVPAPPGTHVHETEPLLSMGSHSHPQTRETCGELTSQNKVIDAFNIHKEWELYDSIWGSPGQKASTFHLQEQMCFSVQTLERRGANRWTAV